jgi:hypothetical protein
MAAFDWKPSRSDPVTMIRSVAAFEASRATSAARAGR